MKGVVVEEDGKCWRESTMSTGRGVEERGNKGRRSSDYK